MKVFAAFLIVVFLLAIRPKFAHRRPRQLSLLAVCFVVAFAMSRKRFA